MDQVAKEKFEEIIRKEPGALTEPEIAFLRARQSYLSEADRLHYAEFLAPAASEPEPEQEAKPSKKKKDEE